VVWPSSLFFLRRLVFAACISCFSDGEITAPLFSVGLSGSIKLFAIADFCIAAAQDAPKMAREVLLSGDDSFDRRFPESACARHA